MLARTLERCAVRGRVNIGHASLVNLKVVAHCDCGCDSVDFHGIDWSAPPTVIADGQGKTEAGDEVGIIVFSNGSAITGLEVYNYSDEPARLPAIESIQPYGGARYGAV